MSKIKKIFSFTNQREIWRLIPSESNCLVIEERDKNSKQAYFNCLQTADGKTLFKDLQLDEKYWIGIEAVHKNLIYFHKFRKPDMPGHKGIYAFDIETQKIRWQNDDLLFLFVNDGELYAFTNTFEGRQYFLLDANTGSMIKDFGGEFREINELREKAAQNDFLNTLLIPNKLDSNNSDDEKIFFQQRLNETKLYGDIQFLNYKNLVLYNYNFEKKSGIYDNLIVVFDKEKNKNIFTEKLDSNSNNIVSESFFILGDLLFTLVQKTKLVVYRIIQ